MTRYDRKRKDVEMLSNFKKYAKRTLAGILTAALILTSGTIPNSVMSVQAAPVGILVL